MKQKYANFKQIKSNISSKSNIESNNKSVGFQFTLIEELKEEWLSLEKRHWLPELSHPGIHGQASISDNKLAVLNLQLDVLTLLPQLLDEKIKHR